MKKLIEQIQLFLKNFKAAYNKYREESKPPVNKGYDEQLDSLEELSFFDETNQITYTNYVEKITNPKELKKKMSRIWSGSMAYIVTEQDKVDSRNLFFYIFRKMTEMVMSHNMNVKKHIEKQKAANEKKIKQAANINAVKELKKAKDKKMPTSPVSMS